MDEIKKLSDERDSLTRKVERLNELSGEMKSSADKKEIDAEKTIEKIEESQEKIEGKGLIDGPCHEVISTAGGKGKSEVHYYATEIPGENRVKLDYLGANGKSTGLLAKKVSKKEFSEKFVSNVQQACDADAGKKEIDAEKTIEKIEESPGKTEDEGLIDGPYHEVISTAGGKGKSEVHYYATEIPGEDRIKLDYLGGNGKSTGLLAKKVSLKEFSEKFVSCIEHGCDIVK